METLEDLFRFILRYDHVIVFGNLGRYPKIIFEMCKSDPQLNVAIQSAYYACSSDDRIKVIQPNEPISNPIDLLVILEPIPDQILEKPPHVARLAVFTSHFHYPTHLETVWTHACYFHCDSLPALIKNTRVLQKLQDTSIQTRNVDQVRAVNKLVIQGRSEQSPMSEAYVVIDLTRYTQPLTMYLAFWDAFDYMLTNMDLVQRWIVCFPQTRGRLAFDQFTQNCLDGLYCKKFEHGNVTHLTKILSALPFYKSGSIDKTFNVPTATFMGIDYIAPTKTEDICKAATMYNLDHWVGNIYKIKHG